MWPPNLSQRRGVKAADCGLAGVQFRTARSPGIDVIPPSVSRAKRQCAALPCPRAPTYRPGPHGWRSPRCSSQLEGIDEVLGKGALPIGGAYRAAKAGDRLRPVVPPRWYFDPLVVTTVVGEQYRARGQRMRDDHHVHFHGRLLRADEQMAHVGVPSGRLDVPRHEALNVQELPHGKMGTTTRGG